MSAPEPTTAQSREKPKSESFISLAGTGGPRCKGVRKRGIRVCDQREGRGERVREQQHSVHSKGAVEADEHVGAADAPMHQRERVQRAEPTRDVAHVIKLFRTVHGEVFPARRTDDGQASRS